MSDESRSDGGRARVIETTNMGQWVNVGIQPATANVPAKMFYSKSVCPLKPLAKGEESECPTQKLPTESDHTEVPGTRGSIDTA